MKSIQPKYNLFAPKTNLSRFMAAALVGTLAVGALPLQAQPISVPNFSFESATAPNTYPFVNTSVAEWQKSPEPAYFGPAFGGFGITWDQTAGVFLDTNPYTNHDGIQAGYILAFPQVALFQDYNSTPTHDFNATFDIGRSYNLTIGIFGKSSIAPGSTLELSLYYLDALNNKITIGSTTATYSSAAFPTGGPFSLVDYSVNVPTVQAGDAWAGQHIGIELESTDSINQAAFANWDFDNVRLTAAPEPASWCLLALGLGGLLRLRNRSRS